MEQELPKNTTETMPHQKGEIFHQKNAFDQKIEQLSALEKLLDKGVDVPEQRQLEKIIDKVKEAEQISLMVRTIFERGRKETHLFDGIIETGIYTAILDGDISHSVDGEKIKWEKNPANHRKGEHTIRDGVSMNSAPPDLHTILSHIALFGSFPFEIDTLHHEMTHHKQGTKKELILHGLKTGSQELIEQFKNDTKGKKSAPNKIYSRPTELLEAHSWRTANHPPDETTPEEVATEITSLYNTDPQKTISAIKAIDSFLALGLSISEIGAHLVRTEEWDEEQKVYPEIQRAIQDEMQKRGLDETNLEKLKEIYILQRKIDKHKVLLIAQEELLKWKAKKDIESKQKES